MYTPRLPRLFGTLALCAACNLSAHAQEVKTVFVIAMENHNWTQPANQSTGGIQQIFQNPNAPFINSLVDGTAWAEIDGRTQHISEQVAYASAYHNVLATMNGSNPHIHPSEPNYIWAEAGNNFGVANDNDPFAANGPNNQNTTQHLVTLLTKAGKTWKSYQEDTELTPDANGKLTNVPLSPSQYTVPLSSISGTFTSGVNQFNGSAQYNYAAKHNPMVFFTDSNGGNDKSTSNPLASHYAPLQQFFSDLENNTVADYNWITPNQFNDMHTTLSAGYKGLTGDPAKILQGDDFLRQVIPVIMASKAYQDNGVIILWWDESETDGITGDNPDAFDHTVPEIIISKHAHKNENGIPYASPVNLSHSSDLKTMQEIFHVEPLLGDTVNVNDLSDLFQPGAIQK
ncbi:alkaline phosphatase family protein [Edaphobacter aggregans]|uniref:alkaline phosphatase family protein n=1 Tax=Edaphobacter aggregans TaxID=570835 RepID=UPI00068C8A7D|nr:alkaline phosphatase family protein [Edaphobacter aggregans]